MPEEKLTYKQELFIKHYAIYKNGRQAAIAAGYSENTATEQAYENLMKPHIKKAVEQAKKDISDTLGIDKLTMINKLVEISNNQENKAVDIMKAVEMILKAMGWNEPDMHKFSGQIDSNQKHVVEFTNFKKQ